MRDFGDCTVQDFEKLGAFYLGKQTDPSSGALDGELLLYDSKDLTTHAVIIGMTGSGKTGLGIGLIEEAALDHVPVIAIDPKGDLGNLLLSFPQLRGADFEPWVDPRAALERGLSPAEHAQALAELWRAGLKEWGQTPGRIGNFAAAVDRHIYTPGSSAGEQISVLSKLAPPPQETIDDDELYRELVDATAASLLTLTGLSVDPLTSREHIYLAMVIDRSWRAGSVLDLAALIAALQSPGFDRVGVMDLDTFYPPEQRFALAMRFNNLLAAPRFQSWLQGRPIDIDALLYGPSGKPAISIMSIAHLDDDERMFFVTMLLNHLIAWMRKQPGSSSLRAILYMDEVFGFMPPLSNPPSKRLLLTLMKQARAYGLGVVLATQNPVDLDYKGLSNAGTWFLGRLQTERDKQRVIEGLRGAASGAALGGVDLDATLSGLGKRRFLLHNVHENAPVLFQTRWVLSYLAGPLTRDQIRRLTEANPLPAPSEIRPRGAVAEVEVRPLLPPKIKQRFLPANGSTAASADWVYWPRLLASGELTYTNARLKIDEIRPFMLSLELEDDTVNPEWADAEPHDFTVQDLRAEPAAAAKYSDCPAPLAKDANYSAWEKALKRWLREHRALTLYKSPALKESSMPGESERDFRIRLQQLGNIRRDEQVAKLKAKYQSKVTQLNERLRRAQQVVEREETQAKSQKIDAALSFGTAVLGALLGRKTVSVTSASRMGTAVRKAGRIGKESGDVHHAKETLEAVRASIAELDRKLQADVDTLNEAYDAQSEELESVTVKAKSTGIHVDYLGIGWAPFATDEGGRLRPA